MRANYSLSISASCGDPAVEQSLVEQVGKLVRFLKGPDHAGGPGMAGGTAYEGNGNNPVALNLYITMDKEDGSPTFSKTYGLTSLLEALETVKNEQPSASDEDASGSHG